MALSFYKMLAGFGLMVVAGSSLCAQSSLDPVPSVDAPLPDIPTLMREVEKDQRHAEALAKDYTYRETSTFHELDKQGQVKKTESETFDIYTQDGVTVNRTIRKNGKDLTPDELRKEDERIDKLISKRKEHRASAEAEGKETDSRGHDEITLSRILELGAFSNPRREMIDGRQTILVDYTGDQHAKTHNPGEAALKVLTGTVWVDEQDRVVRRIEAHFFADFKIGGGLMADIRKDTAFAVAMTRINNEVWLPASLDAHGHARYLVFFSLNGDVHVQATDYRKFRAKSTILPGFTPVPEDSPAPKPPILD
jgi:hypothetical protein